MMATAIGIFIAIARLLAVVEVLGYYTHWDNWDQDE